MTSVMPRASATGVGRWPRPGNLNFREALRQAAKREASLVSILRSDCLDDVVDAHSGRALGGRADTRQRGSIDLFEIVHGFVDRSACLELVLALRLRTA